MRESISVPPSAGATHEVEFTFHTPEAKKACIAGKFNAWNTNSMPMKKARTGPGDSSSNCHRGNTSIGFTSMRPGLLTCHARNWFPIHLAPRIAAGVVDGGVRSVTKDLSLDLLLRDLALPGRRHNRRPGTIPACISGCPIISVKRVLVNNLFIVYSCRTAIPF